MMRDFNFLRRNSGKNSSVTDEIENVNVNSSEALVAHSGNNDALTRPPLNTIQEPIRNTKLDLEHGNTGVGVRSKGERTPTKVKGRSSDDTPLPLRTPDKYGFSARNRFGWGQKNEPGSVNSELRDDTKDVVKHELVQSSHVNGGYPYMTPRSTSRMVGRANSESNSQQGTPTKSVNKPPNPGLLRNKADGNGGVRSGNFAPLYKGMPLPCAPPTIVNTVEVPHFDLKEDPSFWMEHNVQVLIRVRPLNNMEKSTNGFSRCLKQESAQTVSWVGQPETRFTFDHIACETVDQEMLFRMAGLPMVENCLSGYNSCMFAYGQTGSGKTHTMLGDIDGLEIKPSTNRGMTPRIFEFLLARIRAEEESRRDERLQYNCKCSFLEIYNEQVTDLLEPSSTNLLLREDMKNGVYVENLSEFEVHTVSDILKLLLQGSSNRKVAATNMNRESSRSHSVFTCVIESRWEKDSTSNLRFARLNLVDLAGSERQKASGAEGERLKEAANINKSLSTLGHVIMVLFDVAHGKPKHVPYRDSRLTFLLQDSLGGNSKTMIIANVSPSMCCAAETLNTLKFAQRAKLIQNNAVVNEDSSGDVTTLQHQIRLLKEELSILKRQNVSRSLSFGSFNPQDTAHMLEYEQFADGLVENESRGGVRMSSKQLQSLETTLAGALRREQMGETFIKQLEAEIEQLNQLVCQREEDNRCTKMTLRFREDKISRMGSLLDNVISADTYLLHENTALSEEIQMLQAKLDTNSEVTRFALKNIRLKDQLRRFQDFYEEGEREMLLTEVSGLRDQLLQFLDGNSKQHSLHNSKRPSQAEVHFNTGQDPLQSELENTLSELDKCRSNLNSCLEENAKMSREIHDLRSLLNNLPSAPVEHNDNVTATKESSFQKQKDEENHEYLMSQMEEVVNLHLELDIIKIILKEEKSARRELEAEVVCLNRHLDEAHAKYVLFSKESGNVMHDLKNARSVIEALESQQILLINEMEDLKNNKNHFGDKPPLKHSELVDSHLQKKVKKMQESLENAKRLNVWYQTNRAFQTSNEEEMNEVCKQAEAETAEVIVCLQEELIILQQQVQERSSEEIETTNQISLLKNQLKEQQEKICLMTEDYESLVGKLEEKDMEINNLSKEWELMMCQLEEVLVDGHEEILDASDQLDLICSSFDKRRTWVSGQVSRMIEIISEKELSIVELRRCLEDANKRRSEVDCMVGSLRGATLAITDAHQQEVSEKENKILTLENRIKVGEQQIKKASICATAAFVIVNRFSEINHSNSKTIQHKDMLLSESREMNLRGDALLHNQVDVAKEAEKRIQSLQKELEASEERACSVKHNLEEIEEKDIFNTSQRIAQLKAGVSTLRSSIYMPVEEFRSPQKENTSIDNKLTVENFDGTTESDFYFGIGRSMVGSSCDIKTLETEKTCKSVFDREGTIVLLKKELQSACESLKEVEAEIARLQGEKQETCLYEKQNQQSMTHLIDQVLALQVLMINLEEQSGHKLVNLDSKLLSVEQIFHETWASWSQTKETIELTVGDAMINNTKFVEAQDLMQEADIMINGLLMANKTMKFETEVLKNEKVVLTNEVQNLKSINNLKDQQYENLEKKFESNSIETKALVLELEDIIAQVQVTSMEGLNSLARDIHCMNSEFVDSTKLMRLELENIFTEVFFKDCAVSVLHLCHTGILLETVTGMNAENGFLHHGLCESNSVITDLKEHNVKSRRELEMCRVLKGKLLADIKNSFARILRKEAETGELTRKLSSFEERLMDLQLQEELMLQRSNNMGSELAFLMKELDTRNTNVLSSLLDHQKILRDKEEDLESQAEVYIDNLFSTNLQSIIFESGLKEIATLVADMEREQNSHCAVMQNLKNEFIILKVDVELKELFLEIYEDEVCLLQNKNEEMIEVNKVLEHDIQMLKVVAISNDTLVSEFNDVMESKGRLLINFEALESENKKLLGEFKIKETALADVSSDVADLRLQNQKFQEEISVLESLSHKLKNELHMKDAEVTNISCLQEENVTLKNAIMKLKKDNDMVSQDMEKNKSGYESSLYCINGLEMENGEFRDKNIFFKSCTAKLESDIKQKNVEQHELQHSHSAVIVKNLCIKDNDLEVLVDRISKLKEVNDRLKNEVDSQEKSKHKVLTLSSLMTSQCFHSVESIGMVSSRISKKLENLACMDTTFQNICHRVERTSQFIEELQYLEDFAKEISSENVSLHNELQRKNDMLKGLLFDLSLLQESKSNNKDQKDEIEEMLVSLDALEDELRDKSGELDEALTRCRTLEAQLEEKMDIICYLECNVSQEHESVIFLSGENIELRTSIEVVSAEKISMEEELAKMGTALLLMNELTNERDQLQIEVLHLKEKLDIAETEAERNEEIAAEAQQLAESRKVYAEEKEEEVKLLERSVEELECTLDVLENKVDLVKGEAEQQRLQREELESELHTIKYQLQDVKSCDADMKRDLDEKEKELKEALKCVHALEMDIADSHEQILKLESHISEINLHAEAQACEYKKKFKALEGMVEQVKVDGYSTHATISSSNKLETNVTKSKGSVSPFKCTGQVKVEGNSTYATNSSSNKLEKNGSKSKGSGSPFKCMGLGLVHQIKSEKDEEFIAARLRIEELEALASNRQKEIFLLHSRLAEADSMTHDVLRDMMEVKLDITKCTSMLDKQQVWNIITEKGRLHNVESQVKEDEVFKLKEQLNEFIEERRRWIDEIDRKQGELVAAQIALEKLRQRDQLLKAENEMLKTDNVNHKKRVFELEGEMKKLSGQQNLHQRIHHHAKIKEENNKLKNENEDLNTKLRRANVILARFKEETACYRASIGINPLINFDEEQRLNDILKETEEERLQLAQKLLGLCTSILKVAGIKTHVSDTCVPAAEEALELLETRITSLEGELEDLKFKNKIMTEKNRLSELMPQLSTISSRTNASPFLSTLDR